MRPETEMMASQQPEETVELSEWLEKGIGAVGKAANHLWRKSAEGFTGILMPKDMQPEIQDCSKGYRAGDLDLESVKRTALIALPTLSKRMKFQQKS